jgi:hypothetical protein
MRVCDFFFVAWCSSCLRKNTQDNHTALVIASQGRHTSIVNLLLKAGADMEARKYVRMLRVTVRAFVGAHESVTLRVMRMCFSWFSWL